MGLEGTIGLLRAILQPLPSKPLGVLRRSTARRQKHLLNKTGKDTQLPI